METLAQSIASIAPTAAPALTIPGVFALAGNATWLCYAMGMASMVLVALSVREFARRSASPGSLFEYASSVLPPFVSQLAGWSLLLAYAGTAAAVTGGFTNYANALLKAVLGFTAPSFLLTAIAVGFAGTIAYRDIRLSARLMLWLEGVSVILISLVAVTTLLHSKHPVDLPQIKLDGVSPVHLGPGFVLAVFSYVGFESATALGAEARNPLNSIPRAVLGSAVLVGIFFVFCAYVETLGFREAGRNLGESEAPLQVLAAHSGLAWASPFIAVGALLTFFTCTLACITAGARILFSMARRGLLPVALGRAHERNETPHWGVLLVALFTFLLCGPLSAYGAAGFDINGWLGTLATYGFIVAYLLVVVAAPIHSRRHEQLTLRRGTLAGLAAVTLVAAFVLSLNPMPPAPYNYLPYYFAGYLVFVMATVQLLRRRGVAV
jgi:amino acid transporter